MKFRELGGILCMQGASLRMKGVVYKVCLQHIDVWDRNLGDESRSVSDAASHREKNTENDMQSDNEG